MMNMSIIKKIYKQRRKCEMDNNTVIRWLSIKIKIIINY